MPHILLYAIIITSTVPAGPGLSVPIQTVSSGSAEFNDLKSCKDGENFYRTMATMSVKVFAACLPKAK